MPRYRLNLEYDGSGYVGWQRQENGPSVQAALETAIRAFCGETVTVMAAGRTDAGVHALGQVAHVDLAKDWDAETVQGAINQHLRPQPIAVLAAEAVDGSFHARFQALERRYLYRIVCRRAPLTMDRGRAWHVARELDGQAMHEAAQVLIGKHDFSTFRDSQCQAKSPVKTLDELAVRRDGDLVHVVARARSFLHRQVRSMVGSLAQVGDGKWTKDDLRAALEACDRQACGVIAPPDGLYLAAVRYSAPNKA
jgi:tRNA pseudouridine38-40 synthase